MNGHTSNWPRWLHCAALLGGTCFIAYLFANVEVQIEGSAGWAVNLPTWRIERHWLLDLLFGGRAMTGYHAWMLPTVAAFFHLPLLMSGRWSWRLEARALACMCIFWIAEDVLWFICNPAFGWAKLNPIDVPWHKHWFLGLPSDYWLFSSVSTALLVWSFRSPRCATLRSSVPPSPV